MEEQQTYTVDQVAKRLQVSAKTVRNWIRDRKLRAKKSGRAFRITESSLQEFLEAYTMVSPVGRPRRRRLRREGAPAEVVVVDGRRLKATRKEQGMTTRELSRRSGVSERRIFSLESGRPTEVRSTQTTLQEISKALGVNPARLMKRGDSALA